MTKEELTIFNVGCNLDTLMNLDPEDTAFAVSFTTVRVNLRANRFQQTAQKG